MQPAIKKIVVTGPESTGKTSLAAALAERLQCGWAPEFARYYVGFLGRPYTREDLEAIGRGQRAWENWYTRKARNGYVVLDTDWTVLQIWEFYRFNIEQNFTWQLGYGERTMADLYLLCMPDIDWTPDPLREHPNEREILYLLYFNLLKQYNLPFVEIKGTENERVEQALNAIAALS